MKKISALILISLLCFSLFSCSKKIPEGYAVYYGDTGIPEDYFMSEATGYKNNYLFYYLGFDGDSKTIWDMDSEKEGFTIGEAIVQMTLEECAAVAWVVDWAKNQGITLTEEDMKLIEEDLAALEEELGGREEYLEFIEKVGLSEEAMQTNSELSLLYQYGMETLTSEGGEYEITDEEVDEYFNENYVAVKHIYVNNVAEIDESSGEYVQISSENLEQQNARADMYEEGLKGGDDFDLLYVLSDDNMQPVYPEGMTISRGDVASIDYENAAFELEVGEWKRVDIPNYGIYFIKRVEIPEEGYERREEARYILQGDVEAEIWNEYEKEFIVNEDFISGIDVKSLPVTQ